MLAPLFPFNVVTGETKMVWLETRCLHKLPKIIYIKPKWGGDMSLVCVDTSLSVLPTANNNINFEIWTEESVLNTTVYQRNPIVLTAESISE